MPNSTVIRIDRGASGELMCKLISSPCTKPGVKFEPFSFASVGTTREDGEHLFAQLTKVKSIETAFLGVLDVPPLEKRPIVIEAASVLAESIFWEALYRDRFLALDRRWPIARKPQTEFPLALPRSDFVPPLRLLAVLSASNLDAIPEWTEMYGAVVAARAAGMPVEVTVITGDGTLWNLLDSGIKTHAFTGLTLHAVSDASPSLEHHINACQPHILHFFCHGIIDAGSAWLDLQTLIPGLSLKLSVDTLMSYSAVRTVWLIVLNSCVTGQARGDVPSMSYRLVSKGGVPLTIGMLDTVTGPDAYALTRGYYNRFFYCFAEAYKQTAIGAEIAIDWADPLHAARLEINAHHLNQPESRREWALPVLYSRQEPFTVYKGSGRVPPEILAMAVELLSQLPPNTPAAIKKALLESILNSGSG